MMIALLLLITGCQSKTEYKLVINEDKSMNFSYIVAVDNDIIGMLAGNTESTLTEKTIWATLDEATSDDDKIIEQGFTKERYETEELKGFRYQKKIMNIDNLSGTEAISSFENVETIADQKLFVKDGDVYKANFKVVQEDNTNLPTEEGSTSNLNIEGGSLNAKDFLDTSFVITFPEKPISHNATEVSDDGKTLTWNLLETENIQFEFSFPKDNSIMMYLIGGGVIVLLLIIFVVISKSRNKRVEYDAPQPTSSDYSMPQNYQSEESRERTIAEPTISMGGGQSFQNAPGIGVPPVVSNAPDLLAPPTNPNGNVTPPENNFISPTNETPMFNNNGINDATGIVEPNFIPAPEVTPNVPSPNSTMAMMPDMNNQSMGMPGFDNNFINNDTGIVEPNFIPTQEVTPNVPTPDPTMSMMPDMNSQPMGMPGFDNNLVNNATGIVEPNFIPAQEVTPNVPTSDAPIPAIPDMNSTPVDMVTEEAMPNVPPVPTPDAPMPTIPDMNSAPVDMVTQEVVPNVQPVPNPVEPAPTEETVPQESAVPNMSDTLSFSIPDTLGNSPQVVTSSVEEPSVPLEPAAPVADATSLLTTPEAPKEATFIPDAELPSTNKKEKICPNCGAKLEANASVCFLCGKNV